MNQAITISKHYLNTLVFSGDILQITPETTFIEFKAFMGKQAILLNNDMDLVRLVSLEDEDLDAVIAEYAETDHPVSLAYIDSELLDENEFNRVYGR